jgi:transcriptional regulator with XRE-family HTH domain
MRFAEAFRETMFRFNLKGSELAEKTGLTPNQISDFRNDKLNPRADSIEKILTALTQEQREYFLLLVSKEGEPGHVPLPKSDADK